MSQAVSKSQKGLQIDHQTFEPYQSQETKKSDQNGTLEREIQQHGSSSNVSGFEVKRAHVMAPKMNLDDGNAEVQVHEQINYLHKDGSIKSQANARDTDNQKHGRKSPNRQSQILINKHYSPLSDIHVEKENNITSVQGEHKELSSPLELEEQTQTIHKMSSSKHNEQTLFAKLENVGVLDTSNMVSMENNGIASPKFMSSIHHSAAQTKTQESGTMTKHENGGRVLDSLGNSVRIQGRDTLTVPEQQSFETNQPKKFDSSQSHGDFGRDAMLVNYLTGKGDQPTIKTVISGFTNDEPSKVSKLSKESQLFNQNVKMFEQQVHLPNIAMLNMNDLPADYVNYLQKREFLAHLNRPYKSVIDSEYDKKFTVHTGTNGLNGFREQLTGRPTISNNFRDRLRQSNKLTTDQTTWRTYNSEHSQLSQMKTQRKKQILEIKNQMSVSINQHKIGRSLNPSTASRGFQGNGLETPQSSLAMDTRRFTASIDTTIKGHSLTSFLEHAGHGHASLVEQSKELQRHQKRDTLLHELKHVKQQYGRSLGNSFEISELTRQTQSPGMTADATQPESTAAENKRSQFSNQTSLLLKHYHQAHQNAMDPDVHYTLLEGSSRYGFSSKRKQRRHYVGHSVDLKGQDFNGFMKNSTMKEDIGNSFIDPNSTYVAQSNRGKLKERIFNFSDVENVITKTMHQLGDNYKEPKVEYNLSNNINRQNYKQEKKKQDQLDFIKGLKEMQQEFEHIKSISKDNQLNYDSNIASIKQNATRLAKFQKEFVKQYSGNGAQQTMQLQRVQYKSPMVKKEKLVECLKRDNQVNKLDLPRATVRPEMMKQSVYGDLSALSHQNTFQSNKKEPRRRDSCKSPQGSPFQSQKMLSPGIDKSKSPDIDKSLGVEGRNSPIGSLLASSPGFKHSNGDSEQNELSDEQNSAAESNENPWMRKFKDANHERKQKCIITLGVQQVIEFIDDKIATRKQLEENSVMNRFKTSLSKRRTSLSPKASHGEMKTAKNTISPMSLEQLFGSIRPLATDPSAPLKSVSKMANKEGSVDVNRDLQLIKEIIDEEEKRTLRMQKEAISRYNSQGSFGAGKDSHKIMDSAHMVNCNCEVKMKAKNFIRKIRNMPQGVYNVTNKAECQHEQDSSTDKERLVLFMMWFDSFHSNFAQQIKDLVIDKEIIFRGFSRLILSEFNPILENLKQFVVQNGLLEDDKPIQQRIEDYNHHLVLKQRKAVPIKRVLNMVTETEPSSDEESAQVQDNFIDLANEINKFTASGQSIVQNGSPRVDTDFVPIQKHNETKVPQLHLTVNKDIVINKTIYENFLSMLAESKKKNINDVSQSVSVGSLERSDEELTEEVGAKADITVEGLQNCVYKGLEYVVNKLLELKNNPEAPPKHKYAKQTEPESDKNIQCLIKDVLDKTLDDRLGYQAYQRDKVRRQMKSFDPDEIDETPAVSPRVKIPTDQKLQADTKPIQLMADFQQKQQFYNDSKKLNQQPNHKVAENNPKVTYFKESEKRHILSQPRFMSMIKHKKLTLQNYHISFEHCQALAKYILDPSNEIVKIERLVIDDCGIDDDKLNEILKCILAQDCITSITLMNCGFGKESQATFEQILDKQVTLNKSSGARKDKKLLEELRLINLKGLKKRHLCKIFKKYQDNMLSSLVRLQLSQLDLYSINDKQPEVVELIDILGETLLDDLQELNLSFIKISLKHLHQLLQLLIENESIQILSLKGISILSQTLHETSLYDKSDASKLDEESHQALKGFTMENLKLFIQSSPSLTHLDLSSMSLGPLLLQLCDSIAQSTYLLSVHIGENNLDKDCLHQIINKFNITRNELGNQFEFENYNDITFNVNSSHAQVENSNLSSMIKKKFNQQLKNKNEEKVKFNKRFDELFKNEEDIFKELTDHEIFKNMKQEKQLLQSQRQQGLTQKTASQYNELVLTRQLGKHEQIFKSGAIQNENFIHKHFDFSNSMTKWKLHLDDKDCYVCEQHQYVKVFYRRMKAHKEYEQVKDSAEIHELAKMFRIEEIQKQNDIYKSYPIVFSSFFDQSAKFAGYNASRMYNVKHYANVILVHEHARSYLNKHGDEAEALAKMKKWTKGAFKMIQHHQSEFDLMPGYKLENEIDQKPAMTDRDVRSTNFHLSSWREQVFTKGKEEYLLNKPIFDPLLPEEDDIYIISGYVRPDSDHWICIYDPLAKSFYKKTNITVYARQQQIQPAKDIISKGFAESIKKQQANSAQQKKFEFEQAVNLLFPMLKIDFSKKVALFAFESDFNSRFLENTKPEFAEEISSKYQSLKGSYHHLLKLYKLLQIGICKENGSLTSDFDEFQQFVKFMGLTESSKASNTNQQDKENGIPEADLQKIFAENQGIRITRVQFVSMILSLLRSLSVTNGQQSIDNITLFKEQYLLPFLRKADLQNDLEYLRELYIFTNRPLMSLLQFNMVFLKSIYHHPEVFDFGKKTFSFTKSLNVLHKLLNQTAGKANVAVPVAEASDGRGSQASMKSIKAAAAPEWLTIEKLNLLAKQSQCLILDEHIGLPDQQDQTLSFEEFIHLLVLCAIEKYLDVGHDQLAETDIRQNGWVNANQNKFTFNKVSQGSFDHVQLAQNVQELIILLNSSCNELLPQPRTEETEGGPDCLHSIERLRYISKTGSALEPPEVTPIDFEADLNSEEYADVPTFGATVEIKHVIKALKRAYLPPEKLAPKVKPKASLLAQKPQENKAAAEGTDQSSESDDGYMYLEHQD